MWLNTSIYTSFLRRRKIITFIGVSFLIFIILRYFLKDSNREVPGWSINTPRNTSLYVKPENNTLIITPKFQCTDPFLLIIVHSSVKNKKSRSVVRNTWASRLNSYSKSLNVSIKVAFILGKSRDDRLNAPILNENSQHGDIIQEDFIDTYYNLTIKSVMMLKWAKANCPHATFIMKADDNVFINIPVLVKTLKKSKTTGVLMGKVYLNSWRITDIYNKWYTPNYLYSDRIYPPYMAGPGYVMSSDVAFKLYEIALKTPILHLEDVFLTGICAKEAHLSHIHHPGFSQSFFLSNYFGHLKNVILVHCDDLRKVNRIWNQLKNNN